MYFFLIIELYPMKTKIKHLIAITLGIALFFGFSTNVGAQKIYAVVETMPSYPGGEKAMQEFIMNNLKYPEEAQKKGIQGRVTVRFVVEENGELSNITIIRGLDSACDTEAVRVIKSMPKWSPGMQNGKNVPVYFNLPIQFRLEKESIPESKEIKNIIYFYNGKEISITQLESETPKKEGESNTITIKVLTSNEAFSKYGEITNGKKTIEISSIDK